MDDIDRATLHAERILTVNLANQVGKGTPHGESSYTCEECDDPIPAARRQLGGVRLCVSCKSRLERLSR